MKNISSMELMKILVWAGHWQIQKVAYCYFQEEGEDYKWDGINKKLKGTMCT